MAASAASDRPARNRMEPSVTRNPSSGSERTVPERYRRSVSRTYRLSVTPGACDQPGDDRAYLRFPAGQPRQDPQVVRAEFDAGPLAGGAQHRQVRRLHTAQPGSSLERGVDGADGGRAERLPFGLERSRVVIALGPPTPHTCVGCGPVRGDLARPDE